MVKHVPGNGLLEALVAAALFIGSPAPSHAQEQPPAQEAPTFRPNYEKYLRQARKDIDEIYHALKVDQRARFSDSIEALISLTPPLPSSQDVFLQNYRAILNGMNPTEENVDFTAIELHYAGALLHGFTEIPRTDANERAYGAVFKAETARRFREAFQHASAAPITSDTSPLPTPPVATEPAAPTETSPAEPPVTPVPSPSLLSQLLPHLVDYARGVATSTLTLDADVRAVFESPLSYAQNREDFRGSRMELNNNQYAALPAFQQSLRGLDPATTDFAERLEETYGAALGRLIHLETGDPLQLNDPHYTERKERLGVLLAAFTYKEAERRRIGSAVVELPPMDDAVPAVRVGTLDYLPLLMKIRTTGITRADFGVLTQESAPFHDFYLKYNDDIKQAAADIPGVFGTYAHDVIVSPRSLVGKDLLLDGLERRIQGSGLPEQDKIHTIKLIDFMLATYQTMGEKK